MVEDGEDNLVDERKFHDVGEEGLTRSGCVLYMSSTALSPEVSTTPLARRLDCLPPHTLSATEAHVMHACSSCACAVPQGTRAACGLRMDSPPALPKPRMAAQRHECAF